MAKVGKLRQGLVLSLRVRAASSSPAIVGQQTLGGSLLVSQHQGETPQVSPLVLEAVPKPQSSQSLAVLEALD